MIVDTLNRQELIDALSSLPSNPMAIQSFIVSEIERTYDGELELVNTMNPFVAIMGVASTLGAQLLIEGGVENRKQYPEVAQQPSELYAWMSDVDYIGRFGQPSKASLGYVISKEEVLALAVPVGTSGVRKLTIPRDTEITAAGLTFTFQYPIDIFVMANNAINIVYNGDKPSPIQTLSSNQVTFGPANYAEEYREMLLLEIPLLQFKTVSYNVSLNFARAYRETFEFQDEFFYCRAYTRRNGVWVEVKTTHSDQNYDINVPTVALQVDENGLTVSVPQIYQTTNTIGEDLRIDIMSTRGKVEVDLAQMDPAGFQWNFIDRDPDDNGIYSSPLARLSTITALGLGSTSGGRAALSFEQLRERVLRNATGPNDLPITPAELQYALEDLGYNIVRLIDNVTAREFLATRRFDVTEGSSLASGVGATTVTLRANYTTLAALAAVKDNGDRITLTPDLLYTEADGVLTVVPQSEVDRLLALEPERRVLEIVQRNYLYSPLHYVYDITEGSFASRPYYFGDSSIENKYFVQMNDSTDKSVSVQLDSHTLLVTPTGWTLRIATVSSDAMRALRDDQVFAQLKFQPIGEEGSAFVNGVLVGRNSLTQEYIFEFMIETNYDLDTEHNLHLTNFSIYEPVNRVLGTTLTSRMGLVIGITGDTDPDFVETNIDAGLGDHLLPLDARGLYEERLDIRFGDNLAGLWNRSKATIGQQDYLRYPADVYEVYDKNVFVVDEITGRPLVTWVDDRPTFTLLHSAGDTRLDQDGQPIVKHAANSEVLVNGQPVVINPRNVMVQAELFLMEGLYYFVTATRDTATAVAAAGTLVGWINDDIAPLAGRVLDQTVINFRPLSTIGTVDVIVVSSVSRRIAAAQTLTVTYYVAESVYNNTTLQASIEANTAKVIAEELNKSVVARDVIQTKLKLVNGSDIIGVAVDGLGGNVGFNGTGYDVITMADGEASLTIAKRPIVLPDNTISLANALTFQWIKHRTGK